MKKFRLASIAALVVAGAGIAVAAGYFPNWPIVGGASYCAGFGGASGTTCTATVPAGPTAVTGSELIPADTQLSGGRSPQTVLLSMRAINALPQSIQVLDGSTSQNSLTATATTGGFVISSTQSLSPTTVFLPASPMAGQRFYLTSNATIASLTVLPGSGSSATISSAPNSVDVTNIQNRPIGFAFIYDATNTAWRRFQ